MKAVLAAALVNFLWQGAAIGALAWLGFAIARTPRVRYLVGVLALAVMAAAPIATGAAVVGAGNVPRPLSNVQGPLPSQVEIGTRFLPVSPEGRTETSPDLFQPDPRFASVVLAVWLLGVATLSLRLTLGWLGVRRLTRRVTEAGANVQAVAHRLAVALNIRARVRIVESALVKVPAVIGAFKPVVLLPAAAMSGLSMAQVEALVAHELAHVRRHDYLVNLLQSAVETLLFYHPAVWLVSRRIRQDRELCCDDLALVVCGDRVAYASALADLESLRAMPSPALAANGGSLVARIRRIL
ncbi:MAG: M56 family metallopeptidase, partial [Acidobacteria bacterium]